jgi:predicted regulator of Ras-like GTPase activity (Roadblock/LC7/MglB family)
MGVSDDASGQGADPRRLLADLTGRVPGARGAALLVTGGMVIAEVGLGRDPADQLAALASGLFSLGRAAARLDGKDGVRQVVAETDGMLLFAMAAGATAVLAVLADRETDAAKLGSELHQAVNDALPLLAAQPPMRGTVTRLTAG